MNKRKEAQGIQGEANGRAEVRAGASRGKTLRNRGTAWLSS